MVVVGCLMGDRAAAAACAPPSNYGSVTQTVSVPSSGVYRIWSRMKAPNATDNAYMLQIDGTTCFTVGDGSTIPANTWTWVSYQNGAATSLITPTLTAGNHTFVMYGYEPSVQLDRVVLTADTACVPVGTGDNCANPPDTTPPVVSITSPANNASLSGTVTVAVNATDDVGVSKVETYVDGTLKGTDTASPYTYALDASVLAPGTHTITAKAYDAANNVTTSSVVTVTVPDTMVPTVSLTTPVAGAVLMGTSALSATASDNVGVVKVEFHVDGTLKGTDTASPYSLSLDTTQIANGTHSITAKAYDAANNVTAATAVSVTVQNPVTPPPDTTAPTVVITGPAAGATVSGTTSIAATATDNTGVAKVEFYIDGALKNTDTTAPYAYALDTTTLTNAGHSLSAKAFDAAGNSATSATVTVTVSNVTVRPEDINQDGAVNLLDFSLLASKFGQTGTVAGRADINGDGIVNLLDFSRLASRFGT
jgi:chitinase